VASGVAHDLKGFGVVSGGCRWLQWVSYCLKGSLVVLGVAGGLRDCEWFLGVAHELGGSPVDSGSQGWP
jgi:hypothetical protein